MAIDIHGRRLPQGSQKQFCAEYHLSRPTVMRMVRVGRAVVDPETNKLVGVPEPAPLRGIAAMPLTIRPEPTWEGKCSAVQTLAERLIDDRPGGKSPEDAAGDLNCQVRLGSAREPFVFGCRHIGKRFGGGGGPDRLLT